MSGVTSADHGSCLGNHPFLHGGVTATRMSVSTDEPSRISRAVPLDQLRGPATDVRSQRSQDGVQSLAASMGDPDVGQLQDILVHPVDNEEFDGTLDDDRLDELLREGHPFRVVDGETRRLAAQQLGWATMSATIVPEPPENTVVAQLDANTERLKMSDAEVVKALYEQYQKTDATIEDMADKVGFSPSYVSRMFQLVEAPDWLREPWEHPDHPLETGHARQVRKFLSDSSLERYQDAGGLDGEEAQQRAEEDARLMIQVQEKHECTVTEFKKRVQRKLKESLDQLSSDSSIQQKQAEGTRSRAETHDTGGHEPEIDDCLVCGSERPHQHKIAIPVCNDDYGMLSQMRSQGERLAVADDEAGPPQIDPDDDAVDDDTAARALAAAVGLDYGEARGFLEELRDQIQPPQES